MGGLTVPPAVPAPASAKPARRFPVQVLTPGENIDAAVGSLLNSPLLHFSVAVVPAQHTCAVSIPLPPDKLLRHGDNSYLAEESLVPCSYADPGSSVRVQLTGESVAKCGGPLVGRPDTKRFIKITDSYCVLQHRSRTWACEFELRAYASNLGCFE